MDDVKWKESIFSDQINSKNDEIDRGIDRQTDQVCFELFNLLTCVVEDLRLNAESKTYSAPRYFCSVVNLSADYVHEVFSEWSWRLHYLGRLAINQ